MRLHLLPADKTGRTSPLLLEDILNWIRCSGAAWGFADEAATRDQVEMVVEDAGSPRLGGD